MKQNRTATVLIPIIVSLLTNVGYCEESHIHDHTHHSHDTTGVELGLSAGYVHLEEDDEDAFGLHSHFTKRVGDEGIRRHIAAGIGAEVIFADHEHYSLMFPLAVYPWRGLVLAVAPGIEWAEHDHNWESEYATHFEAAYVFEYGDFDLGPVIDYSKTDDDEHYMIGVHFGIHL